MVVTPLAELETRGNEAYEALRRALISGRFVPGQKLTLRALAGALGMSVTPVREAIHRLTAERALEASANRSVRIPPMTRAKILELRDIRITNEGLAAARAAKNATTDEIRQLRQLALEIVAARAREDVAADIAKLADFHFAVYRLSHMPQLVQLIESLWLQTGSCLHLLFPDYMGALKHDRCGQIIRAIEAGDAEGARRAVASDIGAALTYIADLADQNGIVHPRPRPGRRREGASSLE
ncbi:MAG: GntR family transcriptional regulator [Kiloniellales bacterium]|nr:GntR family transcriptional regulator [Kiloniellales bacterium]